MSAFVIMDVSEQTVVIQTKNNEVKNISESIFIVKIILSIFFINELLCRIRCRFLIYRHGYITDNKYIYFHNG